MKNIIKIFTLFCVVATMFASCSPDDPSLGSIDVKAEDLVEGIAYKVEHDAANPNIVYLTNLMGTGYTPLWNHPQGKSQDNKVTLKMPFPGTYTVQFGVETRGGIVYGESTTFTIDNFYADFVNDPMWTQLTGGIGKSKTWIHDNGKYGLAKGEVDYADPSTTVEYNNFSTNWSPGAGHTDDDKIWGSTMTFSLGGGALVDIHNAAKGGDVDESGTFLLDVDNKTITFTDANIMHTQGWNSKTTNWARGLKILTLNENQLRVAVLRETISGESEWWMVWNYVSKEYADNYTPAEEPEPDLPAGWQNDVSQTVNSSVKWVLSPETPFNWAGLDGTLLNEWNSLAEYADWTGFDATIPATYANFSLTMDSSDKSVVYVDKSGVEHTGTYTLDDKGFYKFNGVTPSFNICSWVNLHTSTDNTWRITKIEKDVVGKVSGMWVGVRDAEKDQYSVFHLIPQAGMSTDDPLKVWKSALVGKTFTPDVNWFIDWVGFPSAFAGGWTSSSTFGNDYTSNGWVWDANVRAVAESATLEFFTSGSDLKVTVKQIKNGAPYTATGTVVIDPDKNILNINIPLVDYEGTVANWVGSTNDKSISGSTNDWYFVAHGGANLSNVNTNGFWLGRIANSVASGGDKDEVLVFHYIKK